MTIGNMTEKLLRDRLTDAKETELARLAETANTDVDWANSCWDIDTGFDDKSLADAKASLYELKNALDELPVDCPLGLIEQAHPELYDKMESVSLKVDDLIGYAEETYGQIKGMAFQVTFVFNPYIRVF